jgi:hypothetical protein
MPNFQLDARVSTTTVPALMLCPTPKPDATGFAHNVAPTTIPPAVVSRSIPAPAKVVNCALSPPQFEQLP